MPVARRPSSHARDSASSACRRAGAFCVLSATRSKRLFTTRVRRRAGCSFPGVRTESGWTRTRPETVAASRTRPSEAGGDGHVTFHAAAWCHRHLLRQPIRNVAVRVAERPSKVIVTLIRTTLPLAVFGRRKDSRAVPFLNESPCRIRLPATDRSHVIFPLFRAAPLWLRRTRSVTVAV